MSDERKALGPGDDDPRSSAVQPSGQQTPKALGPGDDDPRSPQGEASAVRAALAPGEADGPNPDEAFDFVIGSAAGPGDTTYGPRQLVRIPKKRSPAAQE